MTNISEKMREEEPYLEIKDRKRIIHMEHISEKSITHEQYKKAMRIISGHDT